MPAPLLEELAELDDQAFRKRFSGSPVKRIGRDRFVRNVLIAIGNSGRPSLLGVVRQLLNDASPLVRAMAVWACSRLMTVEDFQSLKSVFIDQETSEDVLAEWAV